MSEIPPPPAPKPPTDAAKFLDLWEANLRLFACAVPIPKPAERIT